MGAGSVGKSGGPPSSAGKAQNLKSGAPAAKANNTKQLSAKAKEVASKIKNAAYKNSALGQMAKAKKTAELNRMMNGPKPKECVVEVARPTRGTPVDSGQECKDIKPADERYA